MGALIAEFGEEDGDLIFDGLELYDDMLIGLLGGGECGFECVEFSADVL